ncbi:MtrB/PioB family decaheme-associated outer membrane protein [Aromatoleum petrolei]|uniref:MtrB/PioB family decaheme-associated outer membrane protein n=1 Tax=Aromatoleum petrolei TaxID=76116 RepID=A0ABX1MS52_9RHOO|nr:MtrB/PioB family decaheme-associated outer membrane protein [Aromatoleum petrolei]NMF90051.1 MtrB/PioB family decaheme-associated outer membrane protein [Aromatoleum petrolei]QTQ36152.1 Decaheme-associated outer membrane protein, MtrB/PioB family [Aromatoleum petrolei]
MDNNRIFKRTVLALAVSMAFPVSSALAQEDEVAELISPNVAEASIKLQHLDEVNPLYRQYYGINDEGVHGGADLKVIRRSDEGRWLRIEGRDLGLRTQEFGASIEQQGDWKLGIDYNQIPRYAPFEVSTRVTGIGHDSLNLGTRFDDKDLKTERTATSLTATKFISKNLQANVTFKNEAKKGERLFGSNGNVGGYLGQLFAPEPIDSNHKQIEASLDYATEKFYVSGSYYASFYENKAGKGLFVNYGTTGGAGNPVAVQGTPTQMSPLSLAPDNQMHQIALAGGYNFSRDTRANLKVSKSFATQDDSFLPSSVVPYLPGMTRSDLGGKVDTTNVFGSLTSRITDKLNLLASWAYEDRDDRTPQLDYANYNGRILQNNPESQSTHRGKLEASYRLPRGYNLTAGYDYDFRKYEGMDELYRDEMTEHTYRIDLRKSLSDTLNGSVTLARSERDGSSWGTTPVLVKTATTAVGEHWTAPAQFSDRERDKLKLMLDWMPVEPLSVQFAYEYAMDDYKTRIFDIGLNEGRSELFSLDASYRFSDRWKANMWYSHSTNEIEQKSLNSTYGSKCDGTTLAYTCVPWGADLKLSSNAVGAGFDGQISSKFSVGGQYLYSRDVSKYDISYAAAGALSSIRQGAGILPDTEYTLNTLRLFARYALTKATGIRLDYVWDRREMDDYTWSSWSYSDGTKVFVDPNQITRVIAVTVSHAF